MHDQQLYQKHSLSIEDRNVNIVTLFLFHFIPSMHQAFSTS